MADVFPKFIIEDGNLIISKCTFHRQLVIDKDKVQGGGMFKLDHDTNTFTLYGESFDFGPASIEDIQAAIDNHRVYTNYSCARDISDRYNFKYDTGVEIIDLKQTK